MRSPIDEIRNRDRDGRPLPGVAYRDEGIFAAEVETLLRDTWISVACGQNVAERGDLFPVRIAGQSLLVVRDADDEIRAFYNLCRHRGAPLADAKCRARAERIEVFSVFPNTLILVEPEFQQVVVLRPQSAGVTH